MTYWQTYRPWLLSLLNQRIYLSQNGYCPDLLKLAVDLRFLLKFNGYRSDRSLSGLIIRKQYLIKMIIPANKLHDKHFQTLAMALQQAESFQLQSS